jgi:Uma2 family endonuclease
MKQWERKEWTDEALMALARGGQKHERLGGKLAVSPTGFQHGYVSSRLSTALLAFALKHRLGVVVDSSTAFRMKSGDCLSPDVSFVGKERLRGRKRMPTKFFQGAPDLAVEVLSPGESRRRLRQKLAQYFANGTLLAWVVNPKDRTVEVFDSPGHSRALSEHGQLDGGSVLPRLALPVGAIFEMPDFDS